MNPAQHGIVSRAGHYFGTHVPLPGGARVGVGAARPVEGVRVTP
ncbi:MULTISPECIES: hypothetical protein [unclassified Dietzia]|nr:MULTISPECIES: hypothetical protein [unclassified Dietzia]QGW25639.1 hypothetical protein GJR88_04018 [Dietzia sp. DQ12-45-1b]